MGSFHRVSSSWALPYIGSLRWKHLCTSQPVVVEVVVVDVVVVVVVVKVVVKVVVVVVVVV